MELNDQEKLAILDEMKALGGKLDSLKNSLVHPSLFDDGESEARAHISKSGTLMVNVDIKFVRQLPRALLKLAWKITPRHLKLRAMFAFCSLSLSLCTALAYATVHLIHDVSAWIQHVR